jgi:hypothetical protein
VIKDREERDLDSFEPAFENALIIDDGDEV